MSLINDVLKKLEHRQPSTDTEYIYAKQANSPEGYRERQFLKRSAIIFLWLLGIALVVVVAGYYAERYLKQHQRLSSKKICLSHQNIQPHLSVAVDAKAPSAALPMVTLANPPAQPSANSQLPPPPDLQGNGSQVKFSKTSLSAVAQKSNTSPSADAATKTLNVPLSSLQPPVDTDAADADSFSMVETPDPNAAASHALEYIYKLAQLGQMNKAETLFAQLPATTNEQGKIILQAKLLVLQNKNNEAIRILEAFNQNRTPSLDTLGMLAALFNETGQYDKSQIIYQQLVDFWPNDSTWWLGLGISAMNAGQFALAISAFQHELTFSNEISPEVTGYVQKHLLRLMNQYHIA